MDKSSNVVQLAAFRASRAPAVAKRKESNVAMIECIQSIGQTKVSVLDMFELLESLVCTIVEEASKPNVDKVNLRELFAQAMDMEFELTGSCDNIAKLAMSLSVEAT